LARWFAGESIFYLPRVSTFLFLFGARRMICILSEVTATVRES